MGDRASVSFVNGDEESVALFQHWAGPELHELALTYARELCDDVASGKLQAAEPLGRLEPRTVMVDFLRWLADGGRLSDRTTATTGRVASGWYFGKDEHDGDNRDNGHLRIDLLATKRGTVSAGGGLIPFPHPAPMNEGA